MPSFQVYEADLNDPEHQRAVVELVNKYAQISMIHGEPLTAEVQRDLIAGLQRHPTTIVFLAFDQDAAIGVAVCFLGFSTFAARPLINIHDLAVTAEYQGRGIGRLLLEAVEQKAQELNCCKVTLEVDENNRRARQVYAAAGFADSRPSVAGGNALYLAKPLSAH